MRSATPVCATGNGQVRSLRDNDPRGTLATAREMLRTELLESVEVLLHTSEKFRVTRFGEKEYTEMVTLFGMAGPAEAGEA